MKKEHRIGLLRVCAAIFAVATVFCFVKAYTSTENKDYYVQNNGIYELQSTQPDNDKRGEEQKTDDSSASMEEFNGLFTGTGDFKKVHLNLEGIPVYIFYMDNQTEMPLLIMQHGLAANKDDMADLAANFAKQGYVVITPDAVGYGELADGIYRSLPDIIENTSLHFDKIIEFCSAADYIDESRIGLFGVSMGALSSLYYTAQGEYEIKMVVSLCGTPDFSGFEGTVGTESYFCSKGDKKEKDEKVVKNLEEKMNSMSPYDKLLNEKQTALFLMCGEADTTVPPLGNVTFYQEALAMGKNVYLMVKEKQGHNVEMDELYAALAFVMQNL